MNKVEKIIKHLKYKIDLLNSSTQPKIIFIGGIPGSGKSLLIKKAQLDFCNDEFSIIESDLYRKYFKEAKNVEKTVENTNKIELELLLYSLNKHKNIIQISSLRSFEYINNLIRNFITPLGYNIYLYVIITNKIDSALSTYERYIYDKNNRINFPRICKIEYLNKANTGFDLAIDFFLKTDLFKEIHMFKRGPNFSLPVEIDINFSCKKNIIK